jgi:hypothetical protein
MQTNGADINTSGSRALKELFRQMDRFSRDRYTRIQHEAGRHSGAGAILPYGHPGHVPGLDGAVYMNSNELAKPSESLNLV